MNYIENGLKERMKNRLEELGIKYEFVQHEAIVDVAEGLRFLNISSREGVSTLLMKSEKGYFTVIRRDDHRMDNKKIKKIAGVKNLQMATSDEIKEQLGCERGYVSLFNPNFHPIMDQSITEIEYVYGGTGSPYFDLKINPLDLKKLVEGEFGDIAGDVIEYGSGVIEKRRILSGITPSGSALHIGNYFGAVAPQIALQDTHETYYFVADLHALTTVHNKQQIEENVTGVVLDYLALGLDPEKCVFFRQSDVPEHSQLAVVLANYISYGQMKRMHAYKDKLQAGTNEESINMGLFNYPILMAADILLYKPYGVPVGEDQRQHIELTRDIAENFNKTYKSSTFPLPEPLIRKDVGRIVGTDGERKMSKSLGNIIGIFDDYKIIEKQIMSCFTDPNRKKASDPGKVEGNPIFIYHDLMNDDKTEVEKLKKRYREGMVGDVEVKQKLIVAHKRMFAEARDRRSHLASDIGKVREILAKGAEKAKRVASATLQEVYEVIGERNKLNRS